jgi:YHS domain-containing protein
MKLLFWLGILGFLYWYLFKRKGKISQKNKEPLVTDLVFDENCQTYIRKEDAIKVNIKGKTYYFCSEKCLKEFLQKKG